MPAAIVREDDSALARVARKTTPAAALAALGIVYGDLGTSPLYTLQAVVRTTGGHLSPETALGSLSLIFWALIITISVKYCLFVMRADNQGEGGILALMSMTSANWTEGRRMLIVMGLFGAALLYGDGIITPAISVLSALEGLNVATDVFKPHVVSMAVAILFALFVIQRRGAARIAKASGPVMLLWFAVIAALGVAGISRYPAVIAAVDPTRRPMVCAAASVAVTTRRRPSRPTRMSGVSGAASPIIRLNLSVPRSSHASNSKSALSPAGSGRARRATTDAPRPRTGNGVDGRAEIHHRVAAAVGCPRSVASVWRRQRRSATPRVLEPSAASWSRRRDAAIGRRATSATTAPSPDTRGFP